jgi:NhaP-type Na+/H+ or K+/H+ antiporter
MLRLAQLEHGLIGHGQVAFAMALEGLGGGVLGCGTGYIVARVMRLVNEPGLRLMISLALVTGTYRLSDVIGVSGPAAVVACGLVLRMQAARDLDGRSFVDKRATRPSWTKGRSSTYRA